LKFFPHFVDSNYKIRSKTQIVSKIKYKQIKKTDSIFQLSRFSESYMFSLSISFFFRSFLWLFFLERALTENSFKVIFKNHFFFDKDICQLKELFFVLFQNFDSSLVLDRKSTRLNSSH